VSIPPSLEGVSTQLHDIYVLGADVSEVLALPDGERLIARQI
jgi:hypothetical protein